MKPWYHSVRSSKKYGGTPEDYIEIHNWFDQTKSHVADMRHRLVLHNSFGIFLCEQVFGVCITNSAGSKVNVRDIGEDHVFEDLGTIPSLEKCLSSIDIETVNWVGGVIVKSKNNRKVVSWNVD